MRRDEEVRFWVGAATLGNAEQILRERGTTIEAFLTFQLRGLTRKAKVYHLREQLTFGKYEGEFLEDIIRTEPGYITWCLRNLVNFVIDPIALELLSQMGEDL
jgi:hypothetical protein